MNVTDYMNYVDMRWVPSDPAYGLLAAAMGVGGEGGEVTDLAKKIAFHDGDLHDMGRMRHKRREHMIEELGDVLYYAFALMLELGVDFDDVTDANRSKLDDRYGPSVQTPLTVA